MTILTLTRRHLLHSKSILMLTALAVWLVTALGIPPVSGISLYYASLRSVSFIPQSPQSEIPVLQTRVIHWESPGTAENTTMMQGLTSLSHSYPATQPHPFFCIAGI